MEEENIKAKRMKLKDMENYVEEQKQMNDEEKRDVENKEKLVEIKEAEITTEKENLRRLQFEVNEKNAILEIILKMNSHTERISLNFSDLNCTSSPGTSSGPELESGNSDSGGESEKSDKNNSVTMSMIRDRERKLQVRIWGNLIKWTNSVEHFIIFPGKRRVSEKNGGGFR